TNGNQATAASSIDISLPAHELDAVIQQRYLDLVNYLNDVQEHQKNLELQLQAWQSRKEVMQKQREQRIEEARLKDKQQRDKERLRRQKSKKNRNKSGTGSQQQHKKKLSMDEDGDDES